MDSKILNIPGTDFAESLDSSCRALFVHGKNGTGKSSLLALWARGNNPSVYLSADRTTRISGRDVTQRDIESVKQLDERALNRGTSTFHHRAHEHITPLDVALDSISRKRLNKIEDIVGFVESDIEKAQYSVTTLDEHKINEILQRIELTISLRVDHNSVSGFMAQKDGSVYDIKNCSDGERGALLLVCQTAIAEPGSLIVIDEPDKHLYDEIVLPTLKELVGLREDCYFAVGSAMNLGEMSWKQGIDFDWKSVELLSFDKPSETWATKD